MTIKNNKKVKLYVDSLNANSNLGSDYNGTFITDPFVSECSRFVLDPIKDYELTKKQTNDMIKYNKLDEDTYIMSKVKQYYTDVAEKNVDAIILKLKQKTIDMTINKE